MVWLHGVDKSLRHNPNEGESKSISGVCDCSRLELCAAKDEVCPADLPGAVLFEPNPSLVQES